MYAKFEGIVFAGRIAIEFWSERQIIYGSQVS